MTRLVSDYSAVDASVWLSSDTEGAGALLGRTETAGVGGAACEHEHADRRPVRKLRRAACDRAW